MDAPALQPGDVKRALALGMALCLLYGAVLTWILIVNPLDTMRPAAQAISYGGICVGIVAFAAFAYAYGGATQPDESTGELR